MKIAVLIFSCLILLATAPAFADCSVSEKKLRDARGRHIGEIRGGARQMSLHDAQGRLLGVYNCQNNQTRDDRGRLVGTGNLLTSLLRP